MAESQMDSGVAVGINSTSINTTQIIGLPENKAAKKEWMNHAPLQDVRWIVV